MSINKLTATNIDNSDPYNFPNGRIKDNSGIGDGTPVNRFIYSDMHEYFAKLMRLAGITYNNLPDSTTNGYQLVDAAIALAGKNDFITPMNTIILVVTGVNTNVISVPLKFSTLKIGEALICQATFDQTSETLIQGTEAALYPANIPNPHPFKNGDYIRFIKTNTGATLVRLADDLNLDILVGELIYLKATNPTNEYAGTTQAEATTPYTNGLAFFRRVCGVDSGMFLASHTRNGLLSAAQWDILSSIPGNPVKNIGWVSGIEVAGNTVGSTLPVSGDISACTAAGIDTAVPAAQEYVITFANAMPNLNYFLRFSVESLTSVSNSDATLVMPAFRNKTVNGCSFILREVKNAVQSIKLHIEVVAYS